MAQVGGPEGGPDHGYFSILGVTFRSTEEEVNKRYKRLALSMHPDKNKEDDAVDKFQKLTTSYQTLNDPEKRGSYMELYRLRCYMSQRPLADGHARLLPHYAFVVEKSKHKMGKKSARVLLFDLLDRKMTNSKKDTVQKGFSLSDIDSVEESGSSSSSKDQKMELSIHFKRSHPYYLRAQSLDQYLTLLGLLRRIVAANRTGEVTDESLGVSLDDAEVPPSATCKSKVIKRASGSMEWQQRYMVLGVTHLLIFRALDLKCLVNVLPVTLLKLVPDKHEDSAFQLHTQSWRANFRVLNADVARNWTESLAYAQHQQRKGPAGCSDVGRGRAHCPSIIFSDADLVKAQKATAGLQKQSQRKPSKKSALLEEEPILALPAPDLAPCDRELADGWLEYTDDLARTYYYHPATNETTWAPPRNPNARQQPAAQTAGQPAAPTARQQPADFYCVSDDDSDCSITIDDDHLQQMTAQLREEQEQERTPLVSLVETKAAVLADVQQIERRLIKAKRCLEGERSADDFLALWRNLYITLEEAEQKVAAYTVAAETAVDKMRTTWL